MEDPRWLRLITIGLVLASLAVGYFLLTGRFIASRQTQNKVQTVTQIQPTPATNTSTRSAYLRIVERNKEVVLGVQTLPKTGFPTFLTGVILASAVVIGWGLKKFPD